MTGICVACGYEGEMHSSLYGAVCVNARACVVRMYEQILARRARERT